MRLAIIGRTKMLLDAALEALKLGHEVVFIATAKESAESQAVVDDFRKLSERCGCPFFVGPRFGNEQISLLSSAQPELGLTMNWPTMISEGVTRQFKHGIINAHGSDLPKYRGNACPNWAIINGDDRVGLTFHLIDPYGLDTGPIVHKEFLDIDDNVYIGDVYNWLNAAIPQGFVHSIGLIKGGYLPLPQKGEIIRAYPRRPEDGRIDWTQDSQLIHRLVRASSSPFPGAFCFSSEKKVIVWGAKKVKLPNPILAIPGQVLWYNDMSPVVACGTGAIELTDYSVEDCSELSRSLRERFT